MQKTFVSIEGHAVRVLTAMQDASLPWLVLWPGLGATAEEFRCLLREGPSHGWNVAALDAPGHGCSEAWDTWSNDAVLAIWDGVVAALGASANVVLGGHSVGAYFALEWAVRRQACRGIVLLEGGYLEPFAGMPLDDVFQQNASYLEAQHFPSWDAYLQTERASAESWGEDAEEMLRAQMKAVGDEIRPRLALKSANQVVGTLANYRLDRLPDLGCPTLLTVATQPAEMAAARAAGVAALHQRLSRLQVVEVPAARHDLFLDNPQAVTAAVWAFLHQFL